MTFSEFSGRCCPWPFVLISGLEDSCEWSSVIILRVLSAADVLEASKVCNALQGSELEGINLEASGVPFYKSKHRPQCRVSAC